MAKEKTRCPWTGADALMQHYHDTEWGVPQHDDRKLFEAVILDTFQAGLSWRTVLHKRKNFRKAFDNFDAKKITKYDDAKIAALLNDAGIIRNKLKVNEATLSSDQLIDTKIIAILEQYVRLAVEEDGGNIQFKSFENGKVNVLLQGACSGCPSSTLTLKSGIEALLKRMVPEVQEVVAVAE